MSSIGITLINRIFMLTTFEKNVVADDSLLFRTINNQADSVLLQNDLASLQDWEDKWQVSFNAKKCQVIRITPKNRPPLPTTYKLYGHTLILILQSKKRKNGKRTTSQLILKLTEIKILSMTDICQTSIDTREVPQDWRDANIVPLFKKDE
jgi:hypothetical protein